jgi:drug/metabolite transporter (DMT)-like permease
VVGALLILVLAGMRPSALQILGMAVVAASNLALLGNGTIGLPATALLLAAATSLSVYMVGVRLWGLADTPLLKIAQALYQGLVVSILATALFTICIRRAVVLAAALTMVFAPVVTPLLAAVAIGETPGAALIVIAVATTAGVAVCALGFARSTIRQGLGGLPQNAKG